MSLRYKGAVISATPPTTTGGESGVASGSWTLEQQFQAQGAGNWPTPAPDPSLFIENLFSTYLYTGNGSTQTITNGIDLSTYGGLWWGKGRSNPGNLGGHGLVDTVRGKGKMLQSNTTGAQFVTAGNEFVTSFNTNGVTIGNDNTFNRSAELTVGWTFRKQPKFFDVVTWTGDGTSNRTFTHNLQAYPACVIIKRTDSASDWWVWHQYNSGGYLQLNLTNAENTNGVYSGGSPTTFDIWNAFGVSANVSGGTYVAYLFASDAGGFGLTGTDNVISCGSYTSDGSGNATINLGYEPQFVMVKAAGTTSEWFMWDTMRGLNMTNDSPLYANTSAAESTSIADRIDPTATGFNMKSFVAFNTQFIYIAIRRGPMKVPTSGTSVFAPVTRTGTGSATTQTAGFPVDLFIPKTRNGGTPFTWSDRLRGDVFLLSSNTQAENYPAYTTFDNQTGVNLTSYFYNNNASAEPYVNYNFRRAPSFFDEVCYTGTGAGGSPNNVSHNLGAVPELMIVKRRTFSGNWAVYSLTTGNSNYLLFNTTDATAASSTVWNNTTPTSSVFTVGNNGLGNSSGEGYVAYLFATCAGVSKVGSYTGTGTTQQINCGFTGGARFVLIKRTDSTGDWYVWDSARGIVAGNDPYLLLNSTAAEVTSTDYVDTYSAGFEITSTAPAAINASGGTFIFLAIA